MASDWWSKEEGAVFDAYSYIIPCTASTAILEGSSVTRANTSTDGEIEIGPSTAVGDGFGVATRAAAADGDVVPVLYYGMYKMTVAWASANTPVGFGSFVMNSITTKVGSTIALGWNFVTCTAHMVAAGSYILGMCMQQTTAHCDEALILIGRT